MSQGLKRKPLENSADQRLLREGRLHAAGVGSSEPGLEGQKEEVALKEAPLLVDPKGGLGMVWGLQGGVGEPWDMRLGSGRSCLRPQESPQSRDGLA